MHEQNRPILLIGNNGQVGWELQRALMPLGAVIAVGRGTRPLSIDLADADSICSLVRELQPGLIINAAAYTAVDKSEDEFELASTVNGSAPGILAEEAKSLGAGLVHYSTDYVFDGKTATPYSEQQPTNPINAYGRSKLAGERAIQAVGGAHLIFRTSWVYGVRGSNFFLTVIRLAAQREELRIVDDQTGSPTWSRLIAEATAQVLVRAPLSADRSPLFEPHLREQGGIYHLTAAGQTSWFGFAQAIIDHLRVFSTLKVERLIPIPTKDYPLPAHRPAFSVMSTDKLRSRFGLKLPDWEQALQLCVEEWRGQHALSSN